MNLGFGNGLRSCWLLALCAAACTGELSGQPAHEPRSELDCHPLALDRRGFRQSPQDVLDGFPSQTDVPLYWVNGSLEDATERLEQTDVRSETRMSFNLDYDSSRDITECVARMNTCRSGECTLSDPYSGYMTVPVTVKLTTEDGLDAAFEMELFGDAPSKPDPINIPTLQWPHSDDDETYVPPELSSDAAFGTPGFGDFAMSFVGYTFLGRFHDPERGVAVFPTPCGGQQQVAPSELVFGQPESAASVFESIGSRTLANAEDSNMPELNLTVSMEDTTACYDIRGVYHLDVKVVVETDGASFEGVTSVRGTFAQGDDVLAIWEGVCGDVSGSAVWSALFESEADHSLCLDAEVRRAEDGFAIAAEVTTQEPTSAGYRVGWTYAQ